MDTNQPDRRGDGDDALDATRVQPAQQPAPFEADDEATRVVPRVPDQPPAETAPGASVPGFHEPAAEQPVQDDSAAGRPVQDVPADGPATEQWVPRFEDDPVEAPVAVVSDADATVADAPADDENTPDAPAPDENDADESAENAEGYDVEADTLHPAMAVSTPTGSFSNAEPPQARAGDVHAGRYRLEQQLAHRGGTLTWRAFDQKLSRSVLVHVLGAHDPRTTDVLESARKAAFATDSRFLRVLDAVAAEESGESSLVVCEFAPGESLEKLLRQGPLSALEAAWVARELADAMSSMHAEGLFHQRINPDTVIITATGNVKIVGFLIEAAMYPDAEDGPLAWSEREHADVLAIGKVLYASLVTRWPTDRSQLTGPDGEPRLTWGMAPAPMDNRGWLTPRQIRSGVSPALDVITDQILSDAPRHNEMPLRTASQVSLALAKVLGTADAAADLERRLRYPVVPVADGEAGAGAPSLDTTARMRAVDANGEAPTTFRAVPASQAAASPSTPDGGPSGSGKGRDRDDSHPADEYHGITRDGSKKDGEDQQAKGASSTRRRDPVKYRPAPRRWLVLLVALVLLSILVGIGRVVYRNVAGGSPGGGGGGQQGSGEALQLASASDFDPTGDGGNAEENPGQTGLAIDGKPETAWQTLTYLNDPKLGKLKPGVGLVVDLGEKRTISSVKLTLQGQPYGVQVRVPSDSSVGTAPATSNKQWTTIASSGNAGREVELKPEQAVESRFVLVYLTSLPKLSGNKYRGGIAEVQVLS